MRNTYPSPEEPDQPNPKPNGRWSALWRQIRTSYLSWPPSGSWRSLQPEVRYTAYTSWGLMGALVVGAVLLPDSVAELDSKAEPAAAHYASSQPGQPDQSRQPSTPPPNATCSALPRLIANNTRGRGMYTTKVGPSADCRDTPAYDPADHQLRVAKIATATTIRLECTTDDGMLRLEWHQPGSGNLRTADVPVGPETYDIVSMPEACPAPATA
jgi:hypothetical protein